MKKISMLYALCSVLFISLPAYAADESASDLTLNIRRIGFDWSKTDVKNAAAYADSPISQLKADSQDFFKGTFDTVLEYRAGDLSWDNGLFMEYGRTAVKPYNRRKIVSENTDKILLTSNLNYAAWEYKGLQFGPTVRGAYDTEFTSTNGVPRREQIRIGAGPALFNHPIIKDLYLIGMYEYDFTYANEKVSKAAAELGWRIEYEIREGVKATTNGYWRDYFSWSAYLGTDLEWDFLAVARLDTNIWGNLTMGPYVQYRRAKSRETDLKASNFMLGISFNYITKFGF